jgi:hypothetical protein
MICGQRTSIGCSLDRAREGLPVENHSVFLLILGVSLAISSLSLHAQTATGSILGSVQDASGAAVPGASGTMTNKSTASARAVTTNSEGLYSAPALPAGDYEVRVEMQSFVQCRTPKCWLEVPRL